MDSQAWIPLAKYGEQFSTINSSLDIDAFTSSHVINEDSLWLATVHSGGMSESCLTLQVLVATGLGITAHLAHFKHGEHHMQAPRIFWLHIMSFGLVYLFKLFTSRTERYIQGSAAICASYIAGLLLSIITYRLAFHRLRKFPGPVLARTTKLWHMVQCIDSRNHNVLDGLHKRYGDFVRTGPAEITVFSPEINWITDGPDAQCTKSNWYDMLLPLKAVNTVRDFKEHDQRRRGWNLAMKSSAMRAYEKRICEHVSTLEQQTKTVIGTSIDVREKMSFLAFDIMADFAFAKNFSPSQKEEWHDVVRLLRRVFILVGFLSPVPWLAQLAFSIPVIPIIRDWNRMMTWATDRIDEQIASETELDQANIASWLIHYSKSSKLLKDDISLLRGESVALVVAGSDTVSSTMTYLLYRMTLHPEHAAKVRAELSTLTSLSDFAGLKKLPHFNACIKETLRLHPPVPTGGYRDTPAEGIIIAGTYIPGNVTIVAPRHTISRLESSFPRAHEFIPERWYSARELVRNKKSFAPFNVGRYKCAGKDLALAEIRAIAAMLISKYHMRFAEGTDPDAVWRDMQDQFTVASGPMQLVFTPVEKEVVD